MPPGRARAYKGPALALAASALLGAVAITAILERAGRPAVPLDDSFIHFQFARRFAEGAPLRYSGDAVSTGATSLVWPALLAPFWKLGAHGLSLVWVAWALGTIAHAGVAVDTALLAKRLTNRTGAIAAGAMCLAFGPFAWFAWSGMETMALAWILVRTTRLAAETLDAARPLPPLREPSTLLARRGFPSPAPPLVQLAALGFLAPLVRPEGVLASLFALTAIVLRGQRRRALALLPIAGCLVLPLLFHALTGQPTGATARVKWLIYNPYYDTGRLFAQIGYHARLLLSDILDGGEWTWIFVPKGLVLCIFLGAVALVRAGRRAPWSAALTLAFGLAVVVTCSYQTFLWNRVRYVWPFLPAGFVLCACLAHELGQLLARFRPALEIATPALGAAIVARLAAQLPLALDDLAQSAAAVDQQQVKLGEWVAATLPRDVLIGVNDTGAIAYLGERRTLDIVGLTSEGQGRAWVAGAGSRFEQIERTPRRELPTHFIVYPEWFGANALLGPELSHATVTDHAILGGDTMTAYVADFALLGSGATPASPPAGERLVDEVDVADLDSEAAHGFVLGDAWDSDDIVRERMEAPTTFPDPEGADAYEKAGVRDPTRWVEQIDGGRLARARDSFEISAPAAAPARLVLRVGAEQPMKLSLKAAGEVIGTVQLPKAEWLELEVPLPPSASEKRRVEIVALAPDGSPSSPQTRDHGPRFESFHYWVYAR